MRSRFLLLAVLLIAVVLAGLGSLSSLQQCCADPPLPIESPDPPTRTLLDRIFYMDMVPRLAALAAVAGTASVVALGVIYALTKKLEYGPLEGRPFGCVEVTRAVAAAFVVGVFYLYGLFVTGHFQLGWFNLIWIIGVPMLLAALTGRDQYERRWGGFFLIFPGFVFQMVLMIALGISD